MDLLRRRSACDVGAFIPSCSRLCIISQDLFIVFEPKLWDSFKSTLLYVYSPSLGGFALWLNGHSCFQLRVELSDVLHFAVVYHCVAIVVITGCCAFGDDRCIEALRGIHFLCAFQP